MNVRNMRNYRHMRLDSFTSQDFERSFVSKRLKTLIDMNERAAYHQAHNLFVPLLDVIQKIHANILQFFERPDFTYLLRRDKKCDADRNVGL